MTKTERTSQKQRTRDAILDGARQLMSRGEEVTIVAAAAEHGISRATAYRYFSDAHALTLEAGLATLVPPYETLVEGTTDVHARLMAICQGLVRLTLENETTFRQYLASAVVATEDIGKRGARRVAYMERALHDLPHGLPRRQQKELVALLCVATGIEAVIALLDVARVPREDVPRLLAVSAETILSRFLHPDGETATV
ncbi:TetR/AcrR family transcriptional regulator [Histidinibacterium lentulum]|nr:TetR/AcrR family transcriptional regulator [Histidinibacterium lentulum]